MQIYLKFIHYKGRITKVWRIIAAHIKKNTPNEPVSFGCFWLSLSVVWILLLPWACYRAPWTLVCGWNRAALMKALMKCWISMTYQGNTNTMDWTRGGIAVLGPPLMSCPFARPFMCCCISNLPCFTVKSWNEIVLICWQSSLNKEIDQVKVRRQTRRWKVCHSDKSFMH